MTSEQKWPEPEFDPPRWVPWAELIESPPDSTQYRGAYVIARFDDPPGDRQPDATDQAVLYVGETHGRTSSLLGRLKQFSDSAGFSRDRNGRPKGRCSGHYAAWGFRCDEEAYEDPTNPVPFDDVYVALCPVPESEPWVRERPDAPGVLPGLFESMLLWQHVREFSVLPPLNNSGRHGPGESREDGIDTVIAAIPSIDIQALLAGEKDVEASTSAAERILGVIAEEWGYKPAKVHTEEWGNERACSRRFGRRKWLCIGWTKTSATLGIASLWQDDSCIFGPDNGNPGAEDEPAFRSMVAELLRMC